MRQGIVGGAIGAALTLAAVTGAMALVGEAEAQGQACRMIGAPSNTFEGYLNRVVSEGYSVKAAGSDPSGSMWAILCR